MLQIVENNLDGDNENDIPVDSIPTIIMDTISHLLNKMPFDKGNNKVVSLSTNYFFSLFSYLIFFEKIYENCVI